MTTYDSSEMSPQRKELASRRFFPKYENFGLFIFLSDSLSIVFMSVISDISYHFAKFNNYGNFTKSLSFGIAISIIFSIIINMMKSEYYYKSLTKKNTLNDLIIPWIAAFLSIIFIMFLLRISVFISRGYVAVFFFAGIAGVTSTRLTWRRLYQVALDRSLFASRRILAICEDGSPTSASCVAELQRYGHIPVYTLKVPASDVDVEQVRALLKQAQSAARNFYVDEIVIAIPFHRLLVVAQIVEQLRTLPLPVSFAMDDAVAEIMFRPSRHLGHIMSFQVQRHPLNIFERIVKRTLDIALASIALLALAPTMLITAIAIKIDSVGPALFKQLRYGMNGKRFWIIKFRSMTVMEDGTDFRQACKGDTRVTGIGRIIRHSSIDELPQLWNVLRGEMSIVGPRPHAVAHDDAYEDLILRYPMRRFMKPGLTGWAQVNGSRGETPTVESMTERLQYDLWYIDNWSIWLDISILLRTTRIIINPKNAY